MATSADAAQPQLDAFAKGFDFPFDDFQVQACQAVAEGAGVLVAAPTGAGKTIVGEFAVFLALATGRKAFYTTPIKALSNQKYADLVARHGADKVGLLTGDSSINGEAPVVVMTTEVLRNMMYAGSATLRGLGFVVMDEVHYLADRFRGAVWEEVIIHLPEDVQVVSLSATVSNAEEFGAWLGEVRGDTTVIVEEHRPVPLWQHMMVGQGLYDLFTDEVSTATEISDPTRVNPELLARIRSGDGAGGRDVGNAAGRGRAQKGGAGQRGRGGRPPRPGWPLRRRAEPLRGHRTPEPRRVAAGDHVHLQPYRLHVRGEPAAGQRNAAHPACGGRPDPSDGRGTHSGSGRRGPRRAGLLGVRRGSHSRVRGTPRRDVADLPGDRRGALHGRPHPGSLRYRDPGPGHQHAGSLRGA